MVAILDSRQQIASDSDRSSFKRHTTWVSWTTICFIFHLVCDVCACQSFISNRSWVGVRCSIRWPAVKKKRKKSMQTRENCVKTWPIFSHRMVPATWPSIVSRSNGRADGLLNASPKLGSHQSQPCVCLAGEGQALWCGVLFLFCVRPSIHVRFQWHRTPCQLCEGWTNMCTQGACVWARGGKKKKKCAHTGIRVSKFRITLCQHYTTAFSLHVFLALWAVLNQTWWLAVWVYKKKSHSCFQPGH